MSNEEFARRILGDEAFDNAPCQAHPLELVAMLVAELREELRQATNRANDLKGYGEAVDKLVRPLAELCGFKKEDE